MVRKKLNSSTKTNTIVPSGKIMLIEMNKNSTPLKTIANKSPVQNYSTSLQNTSKQRSVLNSSKRKRTSHTLKALREIRKYQGSTRLLIPKAPFSRVVKEIVYNICGKGDFRFSELGIVALQEAAEMAIVNLLEVANLCSAHAKRVTLTPADIRLTRRAFGKIGKLESFLELLNKL